MNNNPKISVIMASYLGTYLGSSTNREAKYIRAVNSFINQTYQNSELIIVGDGCFRTYEIYKENWENNPRVDCILIEKQATFSGNVRTEGLKIATGEYILYLDNDDAFGKFHIETVVSQITDDLDWGYYDDYLVLSSDFKKLMKRSVGPRWASIGTSSIFHKNFEEIKEKGIFTDGYGHDFICVLNLVSKGYKFGKLEKTPQYLVAHWGDINNGVSGVSCGDF